MADRIQNRRDTRENWEKINPILLEGEIGLVMDDPNLYKVGDGVNKWNNLPFRGFDGTIVHELGDNKNAVISQKGITDIVKNSLFDGGYSTNGNSDLYLDNIKKTGVYIRKEDASTHDGLLFVGEKDGGVYQVLIDYGLYDNLRYRFFSNDTWSEWEDYGATSSFGENKGLPISQDFATKISFNGWYTTSSNSPMYPDNLKIPGVYIRREPNVLDYPNVLSGSRGGIIFVSLLEESKVVQVKQEIFDGIFTIKRRIFDDESWSEWIEIFDTNLNLATVTSSVPVIFENDKIIFTRFYIYKNYERILFIGECPLTITDAVSKIVFDFSKNTFENVIAGAIVNNPNKVTVGFIYRNGNGGDVIDAAMNLPYSIMAFPNRKQVDYLPYNPTDIKWISHRGIRSDEIPENSIHSVMWASIYKQKYSECDIRYTLDGVGVIMHDETINRTMENNDGSSISSDIRISEITFDDLRNNYRYISTNDFYKTKICSFREYLDACKTYNISFQIA